MERRILIKGLLFGSCSILLNLQGCSTTSPTSPYSQDRPDDELKDVKDLFMELGTCSHLYLYLLNRDFGHPMEIEGRALDPMAGGILRNGYQCGMLWGASMAAGAEAFRRFKVQDQAFHASMSSTQHIMVSFLKRSDSHNCLNITGCNLKGTFGSLKCFLFGGFDSCMELSKQWAPDATQAAIKGLSEKQDIPSRPTTNCASEVVDKLGGNQQEKVMVSGLAGGMGLSGNACGALGAAIWMNTLHWCRNPANNCLMKDGESPFENPDANKTLNAFLDATNSEFLCRQISGRRFESLEEHSEFIKNGGCRKTIDALTQPLARATELEDLPEEGC